MKKKKDGLDEVMQQPVGEAPISPVRIKRNAVKARIRRRRILCFFIVVILLGLAAIPGYRLWYQPYQAQTFYRNLKNLYGQTGEGQLPAAYNQQLGALYDMNTDIGGWLVVPGSDVNLPVAMTVSHDGAYYTNHLFDGRENPCGTPYYINGQPNLTPRGNTVIRGGVQLFGDLGGYRTLSFYQNAPLIFLDTLTEAAIYKVFAVLEANDATIPAYTTKQYDTPKAFYDYVTQLGKYSLLYTGITVETNDQLLTLICDTPQGKLVVVGRRVRENEDYTVDTSRARLQTPETSGEVALWDVTATDVVTGTDIYVTPTDAVK